jgi:uncharacterized iron-regulated membrane protein
MIRARVRWLFQKIHLYIGLCAGAVFVLLGLTGSAIAWLHELDGTLNPDLFYAAPASPSLAGGAVPPTPAKVQALFDRLAADPFYGRPALLTLPEHAGDVFVAWYRRPRSGKTSPVALEISRQVMVDPQTLRVTGERNWGELGVSRRLLMPTLYHLHRYLVGGEAGKIVIGISGLLLFVSALAGIVLWWPRLDRIAVRQAFTISRRGSWPRFNYSFHRTVGFFAAPVLLLLGFSGWYFNLPNWVVPLVGSVATVSPGGQATNRMPRSGSPISPGQAMELAQALYPQARISRLGLPARDAAPYEIRARQPDEVRQGDGSTRITIDAYNGQVLRVRDPLRAPQGDTFLNWLFPLHTGEAFGIAGRVFISCFGLVPLLFFITGVVIWWKRRRPGVRLRPA